MSNFFTNSDGTLDVMAGSDIDSTLGEAKEMAKSRVEAGRHNDGEIIVFVFNDVTVNVGPDSDLTLIRRDWDRAMNGYIPKTVGPDSKAELSDEELAKDAVTEAANQARREAESARYQAEASAHRERVETRMENAPTMAFSDENAWLEAVAVNGGNPFGDGILAYAERWARMMQLEISEGKTLEEVWDSTSHETDLEGMSGASQSIATHLLTLSWVHGAELRRLHNAFWGSGSTDGTVNPSIIRIGGDSSEA